MFCSCSNGCVVSDNFLQNILERGCIVQQIEKEQPKKGPNARLHCTVKRKDTSPEAQLHQYKHKVRHRSDNKVADVKQKKMKAIGSCPSVPSGKIMVCSATPS